MHIEGKTSGANDPVTTVARICGLCKLIRPHQWVKNLVLILPAVLAYKLFTGDIWQQLVWAFVSLSLSASAVYVLNDRMDYLADREHPKKKQRGFASSLVPLSWAPATVAMLSISGSLIACHSRSQCPICEQIATHEIDVFPRLASAQFWSALHLSVPRLIDQGHGNFEFVVQDSRHSSRILDGYIKPQTGDLLHRHGLYAIGHLLQTAVVAILVGEHESRMGHIPGGEPVTCGGIGLGGTTRYDPHFDTDVVPSGKLFESTGFRAMLLQYVRFVSVVHELPKLLLIETETDPEIPGAHIFELDPTTEVFFQKGQQIGAGFTDDVVEVDIDPFRRCHHWGNGAARRATSSSLSVR